MSSPDRAAPQARSHPRFARPDFARTGFARFAGTRARLAAVLALAAMLGGCFQPMYATSNTVAGQKLEDQLRDIYIVKIDGELGNELRNDLIFDLTGGSGNPSTATYRMLITVKSSSTYAIVNTSSGLPEAKVVRVSGEWTLLRAGAEDKGPVTKGTAAASASIDVSQERFANYSATRDAEKRAARILAEMIKAQLAAHFVKPAGS
ncbi:LPS assembly lipoprotein LptE [Aquabacter spiritensis]|uniref:LPS-assembly lipoprotein n=1 Tax=Aquabacter spiritensis TaxID=933073 RepID=A0A4R3LXB5_9HYPH|nr:LPS assembly lipoprotein LptE [Aquabacter spiritensis]TCT05223.1 LPS-assembly lipoprotein [Aquabacter spiritensis]